MLDSLRNFATTLPGKILGALLLIGLAGFGVSGVLTSIGSNTVAKIGDQDITLLDFQRAYQTQLGTVAQQTGQVPTAEQALQMGVPSTVLTRLSTDKVLNALAGQYGLGVSDARIAEDLRDDPSFSGTLGGFDRQVFERALQQNGYTESEFFQSRRQMSARQQLATALFGQIAVPDTVVRLIQRYGEDQRTINYMVLSTANLLPVDEPTDEEMQAYLDENQTSYRTDELRNISVMVLTPDVLAAGYDISEESIAAEYERTKQNYIKIEQRAILQLPLPADATVRWFELGLEKGKSFDTLLEETGLTPTDLGTLSAAQISDAALSETAFSLAEGEYAIIPGVGGQRAVYVASIEPGGQMSLEEAHDQVEERLRQARAREDYVLVLDRVEEQRAAFVDLAGIAEEEGLTVTEVALASDGNALEDVQGLAVGEADLVAQRVFSSEPGQLAPSVSLGANKTAWFDLNSIDEARDQTLDEVRDEIFADMMAERQDQALSLKATEIVGALASGEAFDSVAVNNNLFPQISEPYGRGGDGGQEITASVASATFGGGEGHVGSARNAAGDFVIFEVTSVIPAEAPVEDLDRQFLQDSIRSSVYSDFVTGLRDDAGLRINQEVLRQALGLDVN